MEEKGRILSLRIAHYDRPLIAGSSRLLRRRQRQHPPSETIAIPSAADDLRPRAVTTQRRPAFDPTARCFWIEAGERQTATIICCRKSEIKLSFPHEQFCAAPWPRLRATVPLLSRTEEAPRKSFARRKNPHLWLLNYLGFSRPNRDLSMCYPAQSKTQTDRWNRWREGAEPAPSEGKRPGAPRGVDATSLVKSYSSSSSGSGFASAPGMR
jgi:hypothetical protein